jgi:hypothetical protein
VLHQVCYPLVLLIDLTEDRRLLRIRDENTYFHDIDDQALAARELWEAFPDMISVTTCIYARPSGPDVTFVKALATLPSLSSFELENSTFQTTADPEFNRISGLTRVAFRLTEGWRRNTLQDRWNVSVIEREAYYLFVLLSASSSTLEYIEIPGETVYPEELSEYHWPRLRHLVLDGVVPDRPLISWLRQAPLLHTLDVECFHATNSPQFFVYPDSQVDETARMPSIRSLTLANPSPKDRIFDHLSDIQYLSLPALPKAVYEMEGVSVLYAPIWNSTQAMEALLRCSTPNLVELRISIQDDGYLDLTHTISQVFPSLKVLELHRYPIRVPRSAEQFACFLYYVLLTSHLQLIFQEIPFALVDLPLLTDLRLDLNLRHEEAKYNARPQTYPSKASCDLDEEIALLAAQSIPQLESVSLLFLGRYERRAPVLPPVFWRKFHVFRNMDGVHVTLAESTC